MNFKYLLFKTVQHKVHFIIRDLNSIIQILREKPDTKNERGRSQDRYRRAILTTTIAGFSRVIDLIMSIILVPIAINYLGTGRYGIWLTINSFMSFLSFSDLGLGIGLQNALVICNGNEDTKKPKEYIANAFFLLTLLSIFIALLSFTIVPLFNWNNIIKVDDAIGKMELLPAVQVALICFGIGLPVNLINRIFNGYQEGYWTHLFLCIGRVIGFLSVLICIWNNVGLPYLVATNLGLPIVFLLIVGCVLFIKREWIRPSVTGINIGACKRLLGTGLKALFAQFSYAALLSGPAIIFANRIGTTLIVPFVLTQKLLWTIVMIFSAMIQPLWPAYGEAANRGDYNWVMRTFRRTVYIGILLLLPTTLIFILYGQEIILIWTKKTSAVPTQVLLWACLLWMAIMFWNTITSVLLNGLNHMLGQATYGLFFTFASLSIAFYLDGDYGLSVGVWVIVICGGLTRGIGMGVETWHVVKQINRDCQDA